MSLFMGKSDPQHDIRPSYMSVDSGHGSPTAGKRVDDEEMKKLPFNNLFSPGRQESKKRRITSIELNNTFYQEIEVEDMLGLMNIDKQGDEMYLYVYQKVEDKIPTLFAGVPDGHIPRTDSIHLWIVRNDQEYTADEIRGVYVKTLVVEDIAYHFFCSHGFYK